MKILLLVIVFSVISFSQVRTDTKGGTINRDVQECIQKIYDNPDAIKELMSTLMRDKETMRRIHRELMNDPEMKQMMQEMRQEMGDDHMHKNMNKDMHEDHPPKEK